MNSNELLSLVLEKGIGWFILVIFLLGMYFLFRKLLSNPKVIAALVYRYKTKNYKVTKKILRNHLIFNKNNLLTYKIESIKFFYDRFKTVLFQTMFRFKVLSDYGLLKGFIEKDFDDFDDEALYSEMHFLISEMQTNFDDKVLYELRKVIEYELSQVSDGKFSKDIVRNCTDDIFNHIMYSKGGFVEARKKRVKSIEMDMELIKSNPIFDDNNEKIYIFIDQLYSYTNKAILSASEKFKRFNGELKFILNKYKKIVSKKTKEN